MLVTTSGPGNRFFEKGTRCLSVGAQRVFGYRLHTPAQTGEEQSNQTLSHSEKIATQNVPSV